MSDFEKELEQMIDDDSAEEEVKLPTMEEQRAIVAKLKQLEAEGKLTDEVLEEHFSQFFNENDRPVH
ncbi:restriction endonuclease subunit S [Vibrio sp.]|uniref:Restriction endonuclease subunit S n=1 Tax=Vibrio viridaestus TaxID=2487322 RepID=A0A3N9TM21_9VIBR|nr:restriction endonuclease subunit S [Vibrio viridaestus]MDC0610563.1 restriction endonuclease subunit S [Vibrio sp.]RQW65131.1 restriction endonuclease subunit S [Vibrio viridaestus]